MKAMGNSMNKGDWRVHILVRNETPVYILHDQNNQFTVKKNNNNNNDET